MTDPDLHFTKRELHGQLRSPLLWTACAGASIVLGLAGPFGTYDGLRVVPRVAYWATVVVSTYFICLAVITLLERVLPYRRSVAAFAAYGAASGPFIAAFVWCFNALVFEGEAIDFVPLLGYTTIIAAVGSGVIATFTQSLRTLPDVAPAPSARAALMDRLPLHLRGPISHLSMQDHYVEVHTDKGVHLVLMRLADAIAETGGTAGLQIHRSHWIALDAVAGTRRENGRTYLATRKGQELPVSRTYADAARRAGIV